MIVMVQIRDETFRLLHEASFGIDRFQVGAHDIEITTHLCDFLQSRFPGCIVLCRVISVQGQDEAHRIVLQVIRLFIDLQRIAIA